MSRRLVLLATLAALACVDGPGAGGSSVHPLGEADLRIAVERNGHAHRLAQGERLRLGDRLFFRVSASRAGALRVWVDGPAGREPIAWVAVGPAPEDLQLGNRLVAYELSHPGTYVFHASLAKGSHCEPPACVERSLAVE